MPAPAAAPISQDLLDSLLAPIALYPTSSVAGADGVHVSARGRGGRALRQANPGLTGEALARALQDKTWDASVLSLCAFPQILDMMDAKLSTQRLGDAFLADEAGVMRTVQSLRQRAQQAGNLRHAQQNVIVQERAIVIEPAQPEYVYVPFTTRRSSTASGGRPRTRRVLVSVADLGLPAAAAELDTPPDLLGRRMAITAYNWLGLAPTGRCMAINVNVHGNNPCVNLPYYRDRYASSPNWSHAPDHRRSVAYRNRTTQRYRPAYPGAIQARENYRGRDSAGYGGGYGPPAPRRQWHASGRVQPTITCDPYRAERIGRGRLRRVQQAATAAWARRRDQSRRRHRP